MASEGQEKELRDRAEELLLEYDAPSPSGLLTLAMYAAELEVALRANQEQLIQHIGLPEEQRRREYRHLRLAWQDREMLAYAKGQYEPDD